VFTLFEKKSRKSHYKVDFHSHLIPGIDDGCENYTESFEVISSLAKLGFEKLIITPHIHSEYFPNTEEIILENFVLLKKQLEDSDVKIELEVAAEYYADDVFLEKLSTEHKFLTFGDNFILIETAFINKPAFLDSIIFELISKNYKVILAHPERYLYLQNAWEEVEELKERGVYLQVNLGSLSGLYSREIKSFAEKLIDKKMVDFIGSDCHRKYQIEYLSKAINSRTYKKLETLPILNDSLR